MFDHDKLRSYGGQGKKVSSTFVLILKYDGQVTFIANRYLIFEIHCIIQ